MRLIPLLFALALTLASVLPAKAGPVFLEAQHCRVNNSVDFGCFQQKLTRFEQFVLRDDASWLEKWLVADGLVKLYEAAHITSPSSTMIRAKAAIYSKALESLDKTERAQIEDCKDESTPDGCLKFRYCFKEAYIKIKNVLVLNQPADKPELFALEIRHFNKETQGGNC